MAAMIVFAILSCLIAFSTVYQLFLFFQRPAQFHALHNPSGQSRQRVWFAYSTVVGAMIGIGVCAFHGWAAALFWLPGDWISWWMGTGGQRAVDTLCALLAVWAALGMTFGMERLNRKMIEKDHEITLLEHEIERLNRTRT